MVQKICKIDIKGDISVPFEMFLERANIEDKGIEPMEIDEVLIAGEDFRSVNGDPDTKRALQENCDRNLFVACSDVMKFILGSSDDYMEIYEDKKLCNSVSSFALVSECCKMLKVCYCSTLKRPFNTVLMQKLLPFIVFFEAISLSVAST